MFCFSSFSETAQLDMARGFSVASPLLSLFVPLCCCLFPQWKQRQMFHLSELQFIWKIQKHILVLEIVLPLDLPEMML